MEQLRLCWPKCPGIKSSCERRRRGLAVAFDGHVIKAPGRCCTVYSRVMIRCLPNTQLCSGTATSPRRQRDKYCRRQTGAVSFLCRPRMVLSPVHVEHQAATWHVPHGAQTRRRRGARQTMTSVPTENIAFDRNMIVFDALVVWRGRNSASITSNSARRDSPPTAFHRAHACLHSRWV